MSNYALQFWPVPSVFLLVLSTLSSSYDPKTLTSFCLPRMVNSITFVLSSFSLLYSFLFLPLTIIIPFIHFLSASTLVDIKTDRFYFSTSLISVISSLLLSFPSIPNSELVIGLCLITICFCSVHYSASNQSNNMRLSHSIFPSFIPFNFDINSISPLFIFLVSFAFLIFVDWNNFIEGPSDGKFFIFSLNLVIPVLIALSSFQKIGDTSSNVTTSSSMKCSIVVCGLFLILYHFSLTSIISSVLFGLIFYYLPNFSEFSTQSSILSPPGSHINQERSKLSRDTLRIILTAIFIMMSIVSSSYNYSPLAWNRVYLDNQSNCPSNKIEGRLYPIDVLGRFQNILRIPEKKLRISTIDDVRKHCRLDCKVDDSIYDDQFAYNLIYDSIDKSLSSFVIPFDPNFIENIMILVYSIQFSKSEFPITVAYSKINQIPDRYVAVFNCLGVHLIEVDLIDCPSAFADCDFLSLIKFSLFKATYFEKIVVLDPRVILIKNIDYLFLTPNDVITAQSDPQRHEISTSIMVMSPNEELFGDLIQGLSLFNEQIFDQFSISMKTSDINFLDKFLNHYSYLSVMRLPLTFDGSPKLNKQFCGKAKRYVKTNHISLVFYNDIYPWKIPLNKRLKGSYLDFWFHLNLKMVEDYRYLKCALAL
ncbi:hypothetical protein P9112_009264 [Eukaryota sp. TZLM1-RC]